MLLVACSGAPSEEAPPAPAPTTSGAPDVLVVVLDTLRQDRVGAYGYPRDTTPVLDDLAARGTRYAEARSTAGWTSPAHASLFTGLLAAAHGTTQEKWDLAPEHETLAEVLQAAGYRTLAASGNPMLAKARGFGQGFEEYHEGWRGKGIPGTTRDERIVHWMGGQLAKRDDRPQLAFVNLIGIHSPYDSCGKHCGAFGADLEGGIVENGWQDVYLGRLTHDEADYERLSDLYDAEVLQADSLLGLLVRDFEAAAGDRPHLVVVTSDHGENIGDHGHVDHVFSVYESTVRVPLVVVGPGFEPGVDASPVQLHDLFPTILRAAGVSLAEHPAQGLPLDEVPDDRTALVEYYKPVQASRILLKRATEEEKARLAPYQRRLKAVVDHGDKLIWASDGARELYALSDDPQEHTDRAPDDPEGVTRLEGVLAGVLAGVERESEGGETTEVDEATRAALEALGYLE